MDLSFVKASLSTFALPDPNASQNRAPDPQELQTLHSIAVRKARVIDILQEQIFAAYSTYQDAMVRYQAQQRILDSILSEVHAAKSFIDMLEAQQKIMDAEIQSFNAVLHPIRRLPAEILSYIFTTTIVPIKDDDGFQVYRKFLQNTYRLMLVCRHWRDIALQCPSLWSSMPVSLQNPPEDIKNFWLRSAPRVKRCPVSICILFSSPNPRLAETQRRRHLRMGLNQCNFTSIVNISTLRLEGSGMESGTQPLSMITHYPIGTLDRLEIAGEWMPFMYPLEWWSWTAFLQRFPPLTSLFVENTTTFNLDKTFMFPTIKSLVLANQEECNFSDLISSLPNLETLDLTSVERSGTPGFEHPLAKLKALSVTSYESFPWTALSTAPNLTSFFFTDEEMDLDEEPCSFLLTCPRLIFVELKMQYNLVPLSRAADTILHLKLDLTEGILLHTIRWADHGFSSLPFTKLKTLSLRYRDPDLDFDGCPPFQYFDELVVTRCLPRSNPASQLVEPLHPLQMLHISYHAEISPTWKNSVHCKTATGLIEGVNEAELFVALSWELDQTKVLALISEVEEARNPV